MESTSKLTKDEIAKTNEIIMDNAESPDNLMKILQDIQSKLGYVSLEAQGMVADRLGIPVSKVYGIVSFYNFFRLYPPGRHSVNVCMGTACYVRGSKNILNEIKTRYRLEPEQTTADRRFSLEIVRCIGCCAIGPVLNVDGTVYGRMKAEKVKKVLEQYV